MSEKIHVIMLHGINTYNHIGNMGRLKPDFIGRGISPIMFEHESLGIFTRFKNYAIAKDLAVFIKSLPKGRVVVVGHSNGCAITYLAAKKYGAVIDKAVFINPALDNDIKIPEGIKWMDVWHSPSDTVVRLAALRPFHVWGNMGAVGYKGKSFNFTNFNKEKDFEKMAKGHSIFQWEIINHFGDHIADNALKFPHEELGASSQ